MNDKKFQEEVMKNTKSINRQPSILAHVQRKKITHNEQFLLMKKMQEERLRNQKGNIVEKSQAKSMTRDEIKACSDLVRGEMVFGQVELQLNKNILVRCFFQF